MNLYCVTSVAPDGPSSMMLIADSQEDALHRAVKSKQPGTKITHVTKVAPATMATMRRNQLLEHCSDLDCSEFTTRIFIDLYRQHIEQITKQHSELKPLIDKLEEIVQLVQNGGDICDLQQYFEREQEGFPYDE